MGASRSLDISEDGISQNDVRTVSWRSLPAQALEDEGNSAQPVESRQKAAAGPSKQRAHLRELPPDYLHIPPVRVVSPGEHGAMRRPPSEWVAPPVEDWAFDAHNSPTPGPILVQKFEETPVVHPSRSPLPWVLGTALVAVFLFLPLHFWLTGLGSEPVVVSAQVASIGALQDIPEEAVSALAPLHETGEGGANLGVDPEVLASAAIKEEEAGQAVPLTKLPSNGSQVLRPRAVKKSKTSTRRAKGNKRSVKKSTQPKVDRSSQDLNKTASSVPVSSKDVDKPSQIAEPSAALELPSEKKPLSSDEMARLLRGEEKQQDPDPNEAEADAGGLTDLLVASTVDVKLPLRLNHTAPPPVPGSLSLTLRTQGGDAVSASVIWKLENAGYQRVQMKPGAGKNFVVSLPVPQGGRVQYYFEGTPEDGKKVTLKKEFPYTLVVPVSGSLSPRRRSSPPVSF